MTSRPARFPTALERFVELFNEEAFWESHEVLEGPWRKNGSDFYHGLILYASAFVHVQRGNPHGTTAQLTKAERFLQKFSPAYLGIDVEALLSHARVCRKVVQENPGATAGPWSENVHPPKIRLRDDDCSGSEPELER